MGDACPEGSWFYFDKVTITQSINLGSEPDTFYYNGVTREVQVINEVGQADVKCKIKYGAKLEILGLSENEADILFKLQGYLVQYYLGDDLYIRIDDRSDSLCKEGDSFPLPKGKLSKRIIFSHVDDGTSVYKYDGQEAIDVPIAREIHYGPFDTCTLYPGDTIRVSGGKASVASHSTVSVRLQRHSADNYTSLTACEEGEEVYLLGEDFPLLR